MIAEVIVDVANSQVDKVFDYKLPTDLDIKIGSRVVVPFGPRKVEGYVINTKPSSILPTAKIKSILALQDKQPVINKEMIKLMHFMTREYNLRKVDVLRLFLPSSMRLNTVKPVIKKTIFVSSNINLNEVLDSLRKNANKQKEFITYLMNNKEQDQTLLNKKFGSSVVNHFLKEGVVQAKSYEVKRTPKTNFKKVFKENVNLTDEQQKAMDAIKLNTSKTYLLHGVTGSGKTEVYMQVIAKTLKMQKTAIMLVPEISLTPQVLQNFRQRFNSLVAILHSGLSKGERYDEWRRIKQGEAKIIIGARSAIFAPAKNLGAIIIDEEHDSSYYSETNPRYYTHEIAKFRSEFNSCPLILGSATPKIESYYFSQQHNYELLKLNKRVNEKEMPELNIVDMQAELMLGNTSLFSTKLKHELEHTVEQNNQAMLFINRRGFSSFLRCTECGEVPKCTECDVSLVYHKYDKQLKCHFCNKRYNALTNCTNCNSTKLTQGAIGTQRVADELQQIFPDVKILRMDNDTTTSKNAHASILNEFANTKPSILVGTQMIAKGHDFPTVTTVGIIDADVSLHFSDYRSTERTFQLITQVAGRAGRQDKTGKVILQTYTPKHYVYNFAKDYNYKAFYNKEINLRQTTNFPPFTKIIRVLITGENEQKTKDYTKKFYESIIQLKQKNKDEFLYLDAMKSPIKRIKNKYRYQILMRIKLQNQEEILNEVFFINSQLKGKSVISFVEVDPQNLS
jgi:primosomal protein N' (replication factor Y)